MNRVRLKADTFRLLEGETLMGSFRFGTYEQHDDGSYTISIDDETVALIERVKIPGETLDEFLTRMVQRRHSQIH